MARKYDHEYKVQAVKLAQEIGGTKAAKELGIPEGTIHTWLKAVRAGKLDIGEGSHTPTSAMSLSEEITMLRKRLKSCPCCPHPRRKSPADRYSPESPLPAGRRPPGSQLSA